MSSVPHVSVLREEALTGLNLLMGGTILDCTFGAGGYSRAILERSACDVIAIDRDPDVEVYAQPLRDEFGARFTLLEGKFSDMVELLKTLGLEKVSGIVLDIGISSMHVDQAERGFSFMSDAPLDMRMSQTGQSAGDIVRDWPAEDLAHIFKLYGDERQAKRIAARMVKMREETAIETTLQLRQVIGSVVGGKHELDCTARVFQALRIAVNDELGELRKALVAAEILLAPGGRLCVVSFQSGEHKIIKHFLAERSGKLAAIQPSRHMPLPVEAAGPEPTFKLMSSKAVTPSDAEVAANSRARSAQLRMAERTDAPVWSVEEAA